MSNSYFNYQPKSPVQEASKQEQIKQSEPGVTPDGIPELLRTPETGDKVYLVKEGVAHWITSPEVLQKVGGTFPEVQLVTRDRFKMLTVGEKITLDNAEQYKLKR